MSQSCWLSFEANTNHWQPLIWMFFSSMHPHNANMCRLSQMDANLCMDVSEIVLCGHTVQWKVLVFPPWGSFVIFFPNIPIKLNISHHDLFRCRAYIHTCSRKTSSSLWHFPPLYNKPWATCWSRPARMSQLQFHCPASPMPAAPAPLPLGQPQPGYSIPCASSTLPSESASQPIRSSALPAGSATPYSTTTGICIFSHLISLACLFVLSI